jgi:hypothetical protein
MLPTIWCHRLGSSPRELLREHILAKAQKISCLFRRVVNQQSGDHNLPLVGLDDPSLRLGGLVFVLGPSGSWRH